MRQFWNKLPLKNKLTFAVSALVTGSLYFSIAYFLIRGVTFGSKESVVIAAFVIVSTLLWVMSDKLNLRTFRRVEEENIKKTAMFLWDFGASVFIAFALLLVYLFLENFF